MKRSRYGVGPDDANTMRLTDGGWHIAERRGRLGWVRVPDTYRQSIDDAMTLRAEMQKAYDLASETPTGGITT